MLRIFLSMSEALKESDIQFTLKSIRKASRLKDRGHLCLIFERFFSPSMNAKIRRAAAERSRSAWRAVKLQETLPRKSFENPNHPTIIAVRQLMNDDRIRSALRVRLKKRLVVSGVSFWKDLPGYHLPLHVDNNSIQCSAQIYIGGDPRLKLGTSLASPKGEILETVPYRDGSGYLLASSNRTFHGLLKPVPPGKMRTSVYIRFSYETQRQAEARIRRERLAKKAQKLWARRQAQEKRNFKRAEEKLKRQQAAEKKRYALLAKRAEKMLNQIEHAFRHGKLG